MFYVYSYLDSTKPGKYCYNDVCFLYEPIYVEKGKNDRYKSINGRNQFFKNKINKIKRFKLESIVIKLYENLSEEQSFELETKIINEIGRIDLGTGSLVNMTSGGEGISGYKFSEEMRNIISEKQKKEFSEIKKEFEQRHYNLLTKEKDYKNIYTKLNYICPSGHEGYIRWNDFQQDVNCSTCCNELRSKKFKGDENPSSILIIQDVIQIKLLLKEGNLLQREIADIFGITHQTVSKIKNGDRWSHIKI